MGLRRLPSGDRAAPPVSKHGSRSYGAPRAPGPRAADAAKAEPHPGGPRPAERRDVDPKGGDLCEARAKPAERLVEARSSVDVQITCPSFVKGRKTHRTAK